MSNYIPHFTKKRLRLWNRENDLRRLITRNAPEEKLLKAANAVREARVRVVRSDRSRLVATPEKLAEYDHQIAVASEVPLEAILAEFKK